jgi:hypothetical protein
MRRLFIAVVFSFSAVVRTASAEPAPVAVAPAPAPPSLLDELDGKARDDYLAALELFGAGNFAAALIKFQEAFNESDDPRLLFNMALSEARLKRYARALGLQERCEREARALLTPNQAVEIRGLGSALKQLVSALELIVSEPGASVYVDQEFVGKTPLAPISVDIGRRKIRVAKAGFAHYSTSHVILGAQAVRIEIVLRKQPTEANLTVVARGAETIWVDGTGAPGTRWHGPLRAGPHLIRVSAPGMVPYERELDLRAGQDRTLNVTLSAEPRGLPLRFWIGGGAAVAAGLGVAAYLLFKPAPTTEAPAMGSVPPGSVQLP